MQTYRQHSAIQPTREFSASPNTDTPHILEIVAVRLISPSWAWRSGIEACFSKHLPNVLVTSERDITSASPEPSVPGTVVLIDGAMETSRILEWAHYWQNRPHPAPVLVLDAPDDPSLIVDYFRGGIAGYVPLGDGEATVIAALDDVRRGVVRSSWEITGRLLAMTASPRSVPRPDSPLSPRELTVLRHVAANRSNQEIAELLFVELCTVKHHVHRILQKLEVQHRWDAVHLATAHGWLDTRTAHHPGCPEEHLQPILDPS